MLFVAKDVLNELLNDRLKLDLIFFAPLALTTFEFLFVGNISCLSIMAMFSSASLSRASLVRTPA